MGSDDVRHLTLGEQMHVLRRLAKVFRSSVVLLRTLAALQLLLSFLYVCLLFGGHPLVYAAFDSHDYSGSTPLIEPTPLVLSTTGTLSMLLSVILLVIGGLCDLHTCRSVLHVDLSIIDGGDDAVHTAYRSPRRSPYDVESGEPCPRHQFVLGLISLLPAAYWLYVLVSHRLYMAAKGVYMFGIRDNWWEVLLVAWQPVIHIGIDRMSVSMISSKEEFIALAHMKYD
uniref:Uncharacterized protein TCIL3000_11_3760 n=1 Tax=Trypanosoma congolense (strain IL3000) TaxID=1068625 RepID=G0V007_TRYCI|nr:unnamed protein product [Trypanosoma congolense IL3000]